jgi:aldehyde dehydrogenase (NAD+)
MRIAQEEVFGPVLSVIKFTDDEEAYSIANDTLYGLAAGVWTQDIARAFTAAKRLRAGTIWTNIYRAVSYMMPFGGFKNSGVGRESGRANFWSCEPRGIPMRTEPALGNPFLSPVG